MDKLFNLKMIEYGNGVVEFRKYNKVINSQFIDVSAEEIAAKQKLGRLVSKCKCKAMYKSEFFYNPFSGKVEEFHYFENLDKLVDIVRYEKECKEREEHNKRSSYKRTKNKIYQLSRQCNWRYFVTLTFDNEKVDRYDFDKCMKKAHNWFHNLRRKAPDLQFLFVPEQHKDGAWHIHGLIANVDNISFVDSGIRDKGKIVYNMSDWHFGWSTATKVWSIRKASSYITKYITKEMCDVTKGKRRYYHSRNIPKPKETNVLLSPEKIDEYIQMVADSLGVACGYIKEICGYYLDVCYQYFEPIENFVEGVKKCDNHRVNIQKVFA